MRKKVAVCLVVFFGSVFGLASCAGGEGQQQEVEILEERVQELEEDVEVMQLFLGLELEEEPQQEKTQQEKTQQEKTQQEKTQ